MVDFGPGVSRTLNPTWRQFSSVVFQSDAPLLDSELNLLSQAEWNSLRQAVKAVMPSGFLMDPTRALNDYQVDPYWANILSIGDPKAGEEYPVVWANINGWFIPITGTNTVEGDLRNLIKLYPPPATGTRLDFVFLEAWQCRVDPNPSTVNKPTASTLYKYGNTLYGGTNLPDDLEDPDIAYETTGRIQVQYRLRVYGSGVGVGAGISLDLYPNGLEDPVLLGQGTSTLPVPGLTWTNMREAEGDSSLWRAGDGDPNNALGTIDGYTYAIPVCAVFRRNSQAYVAATNAGNPNQNGAFLRTPGNAYLPDPLAGDRLLLTASLTNALDPTAVGVIDITNLDGSGLEDTHLIPANTFLVIDDEIIGISAIDSVGGTVTIPAGGRGRYGTADVGHAAGAVVSFYNTRPDGLYADQVALEDILDLRRAVNPGDWDFNRLLVHNIAALAENELRSTWKESGAGGTEGVSVHEVDDLYAGGVTHPNQTEPLDGMDGVRWVFSDAAAIQPEISVLCDNEATLDATTNFTATQFDTLVSWDVGPDFHPIGFMNNGTASPYPTTLRFTNGSVILMFIGGADGTLGARGTFRDGSERAVRFLMPKEYFKAHFPDSDMGNQNPIKLRFLDQRALEAGPPTPASDPCLPTPVPNALLERHVGPMYPWRDQDFERPFIALGGILKDGLRFSVPVADLVNGTGQYEIDVGLDFDLDNDTWFSKDVNGNFQNDPTLITSPLLRGQRTLWGMLTDNGRDRTGASSEVYLVLYGDPDSTNNNGAFKVVGAGSNPLTTGAGYTEKHASSATSLVIEPLNADFTDFDLLTGNNVDVEFRSPYHNADDTSDLTAKWADLAIVLTDIGGLTEHPWKREYLGYGESYDLSMPQVGSDPFRAAVESKLAIDLTLLYHPGRGAMARVPDDLVQFAKRGGVDANPTSGGYLRQSPAVVDTTFSAASGAPDDEAFYDPAHVQTWNRLSGLGLLAPDAPDYGGHVVGFTEQDREHELFFDLGSKTAIFRPFRDRRMTLKSMTFTQGSDPDADILGEDCLLGPYNYPNPPNVPAFPKDSLVLFTGTSVTGKTMGFPVPCEYMPRFGRQDIPYWVDFTGGAGPFFPGINHLFRDSGTTTEPVFNIIGGEDNGGAPGVLPLLLSTIDPTLYCKSSTLVDPLNVTPWYGARNTTDIVASPATQTILNRLSDVHSSDLGGGLKGIQLPPYLGIARLYGVYETADYVVSGGATFNADRFTPTPGGATNLLREDADQQTLFILQDGAQDITTKPCDHTYIVPSNVLDLTRIPTYSPGDEFGDFKYVVECTVFGFSRGWINENNFVLCRLHNGAGGGALGGGNNQDGQDIELEEVHMVLPCPAGSNDHFHTAYNRTVYQGDAYMTRAGATMTTTDYTYRYGQVPISDQFKIRTPIQQYDTNGDPIPETPNPRAFEVLASMDFYTTLGTGKVGGVLFAGTPLDVGFTEQLGAHRMPPLEDSPTWRVLPRLYSDGQERNDIRAMLGLELKDEGDDHPALNPFSGPPGTGAYAYVRFTRLDGVNVDLYGSALWPPTVLTGAPWNIPIEDIFRIELNNYQSQYDMTEVTVDVPDITPNGIVSIVAAVSGVATTDVIAVNVDPLYPFTNVIAYASDVDEVTFVIFNGMGPYTAATEDFKIAIMKNLGLPANLAATAKNLADLVNSHAQLLGTVKAYTFESSKIDFEAVPVGEQGNGIRIGIRHTGELRPPTLSAVPVQNAFRVLVPRDDIRATDAYVTASYMMGGLDIPVNAGIGTSPLAIVGMTERLPLGILLQDSDFLCENPLGDDASAMRTRAIGPKPIQTLLPLTHRGAEYERFLGAPGELLAEADGAILTYLPYTFATPGGTKKFRLYRGGGSAFVLSGENPGGPVDWVTDSFAASIKPVLKGGLLVCRAMLVRNFHEEAFAPGSSVRSEGDEIQMVVVTYGILGEQNTTRDGLTLKGVIGPTGYGEGYAAADRYRINGKPMFLGQSRQVPDPANVTLAVYPMGERE